MPQTTNRFKELAVLAAFLIGLVIALPLLGLGVFILRFALLATGLVVVLALAIGCAVSQPFRRWVFAIGEPEHEYKGLHLPSRVDLDRCHSWALVEPDGTFVGVDDLAATCLGPLDRVELPTPGHRVQRGEPLFTISRGQRELTFPSPVSGVVIARNQALQTDPRRVNRDPFGLGWVTRIRSENPRRSRRRLLRGSRARQWFHREVDRVVAFLGGDPSDVPSLPDGGVVVADLYRAIDDSAWKRLRARVFSTPEDPQDEEMS